MKKILLMFFAFTMVLYIAGCGAKEEENTPNNDNQNQTENNGNNESNNDSKEITVEDVMNAPESPESDFVVVDHGNGNVELLGYEGTDEIVVIPEIWNGKKITEISYFVFANNSPVKAIRLSDSITKIMKSSFAMNKNLEIFVAGSGLEVIEEGSFQEATNLHTVVLNDGLKTIEGIAFGGCKNLLKLEIPESVTEIQPMTFYNGPKDFVIIGKTGSYAETYAKENGITFEAN